MSCRVEGKMKTHGKLNGPGEGLPGCLYLGEKSQN